ncbi:MAG: hypothetical protein IID17_00235 [Nitrospinae bacterium]|nr:hypothetical protein [Nitrospinota bacterium]
MSSREATASVTLDPILTFDELMADRILHRAEFSSRHFFLGARECSQGQPHFSSPRGGARWFSAGLLFMALNFVSLPGFAQGSTAETHSPISVEVDISPILATVGDLITYSIRVRHDSTIKPSPPIFVPPEGLEAVDQGTRVLPRKNTQLQQEFWFRLRADLVGTYDFPALTIPFLVSGTDNKGKIIPGQVSSPKAQLAIQSILHLQGEPTDIRDIKPLENIDRDWRPIVLALLTAVLVIALGIFLYLKRRRNELTESTLKPEHLSPQETALRELEILQAKGLLGKGLIREYYFQLSEIFRRYLGAQFKFPALDWTTEEIKTFLTRSSSLNTGNSEKIYFILERTDLVKYAKSKVATEENMTREIISFIKDNTHPKKPELALNNPAAGS